MPAAEPVPVADGRAENPANGKERKIIFSFEQGYLFLSVLKWTALAMLTGTVIGLICTGFVKLLHLAIDVTSGWQYYFVFLPVALFLSALIIKYLAPDAEGHGTEKAIEAVHKRSGRIKLKVVPVKLATTVITIAGGGSAGTEGPCVQIGAGAASGLASLFRLTDPDRKKLVICGIAAGFTAVFGTPLAAALFAIEVLVIGKIFNSVLYPAVVAAVCSKLICSWLGVPHFSHVFTGLEFTGGQAAVVALSGLFFAAVSLMWIYGMEFFEWLSHKIRIYKPLKGLIGGAALVGLIFLFGRQYLGLGADYYEAAFAGGHVRLYDFIIKIVLTCITLTFGGSGGTLTPTFFIGATAGAAFAQVFGLDVGTFAAVGAVAVLAGSANTPIACIVLSVELFGTSLAVYAALACLICYIMTGHKSLYPTQRILRAKSAGFYLPEEAEMAGLGTLKRKRSFIDGLLEKRKKK